MRIRSLRGRRLEQDVRSQHVLGPVGDLGALMAQAVLEDEGVAVPGTTLRCSNSVAPPPEPLVQVHHERKQALLRLMANESTVAVPAECLTRGVAVVAEALVEPIGCQSRTVCSSTTPAGAPRRRARSTSSTITRVLLRTSGTILKPRPVVMGAGPNPSCSASRMISLHSAGERKPGDA